MFAPNSAKPSAQPYSYTPTLEMSLDFRLNNMGCQITITKGEIRERRANLTLTASLLFFYHKRIYCNCLSVYSLTDRV